MRSILLTIVLISTNLAFAQRPSSKALTPYEQELVNNETQFLQAAQAQNAAYVSQAVSDDFKGIGTNGDFYGRDEVVNDSLPKGFRFYDVTVVRLDDDCAVVAYNAIFPGSRPRYRHMSDTWTKVNGQWKLKFQQMTANLWSALDLD